MKYLCSMGLDAKDAKLAKEKGHIENRIAMWDIKLTTAKFLHAKVGYNHSRIRVSLSLLSTLYKLLTAKTFAL